MERRYTFQKSEKLCLKKQISSLFEHGRWLRSEHLRLIYYIPEERIQIPAQVMFSVPKKLHRRAVTRNLLKRRLRESYRKQKPDFYKRIKDKEISVHLAFVLSSSNVSDYKTLNTEVKYLLIQLATRLERT